MKTIRNILILMLLFMAVSCEDWFHTDYVGRPVTFGASSGNKGIATRTIYSGDITNGKERLEWVDGDDVRIWMYWDEDRNKTYESGPECADYKVINNQPSNEKSYGKLLLKSGKSLKWHGDFTGNNGRAREYLHEFYSVYPADGGKDFDGANITFNIPATQEGVNMGLAYMTAYKDEVTSLRDDTNPNSYVDLEYYPRVTTLYIAVENDTDETVSGDIKLISSGGPICGDYTVSFYNLLGESGDGDGNEITNRINIGKGETDTIAFFIRPREYRSDDLSLLDFSGKEQVLNYENGFKPNYKYNIKITVSGNKEPEFSSFVNGVVLAESHKQGKNWQWGWVDGEQKIFWNNPANNNKWEPVPDELIWEIINSVVDIDYNGSWEITEITRADLNIFPNVKTVNINASNLNSIDVSNPNITELNITSEAIHTVKVEGCDSLKTFDISSKNNIKDVVVKDNKILEYFTMSGPAGAGVNVRCEKCPVLEWFSLTGGEGWNFPFHKDIVECPMFDHYTVPGCKEY